MHFIQLRKNMNSSVTAGKEDAKMKKCANLLSKSNLLRLLAELSRSYACCAYLLCQQNYYAGQTELVKEVSFVSM